MVSESFIDRGNICLSITNRMKIYKFLLQWMVVYVDGLHAFASECVREREKGGEKMEMPNFEHACAPERFPFSHDAYKSVTYSTNANKEVLCHTNHRLKLTVNGVHCHQYRCWFCSIVYTSSRRTRLLHVLVCVGRAHSICIRFQ